MKKKYNDLDSILDDLQMCVEDLQMFINNDTRIDFDVEDFKWELKKNDLLTDELEMFIDRYIETI
jgi:hypothetical protein